MKHSVELINALQNKITLEENVPLAYSAVLAENALYRFDKRVQAGVVQWANDKLKDDFTVEDISLADIQYEIGGSLFQALCVMDLYLKNPDFIPMATWFEVEEMADCEVEEMADDE